MSRSWCEGLVQRFNGLQHDGNGWLDGIQFLSLILLGIWVLAVSILMLRHKDQSATPA